MSLKYEPASEPLHISVKWLFLNSAPSRNESRSLEEAGVHLLPGRIDLLRVKVQGSGFRV